MKRITQQTIFNVRPVLGVALLWIPQSGKLLACGGTNWTQVTYLISVREPFKNVLAEFVR